MKKKLIIIALFSCAAYNCYAQSDSLQQQINEQVWKPFIKAFNSNDDNGFSEVHSRDVIRVEQDARRIMGFEEYFNPISDAQKIKRDEWNKKIELRFIQRIASNGKAFEVGYYKTTMENKLTKQKQVGYGKFHVLLRKESGLWKIVMDADAHEKTNEEIFLTGQPI
jgi:ketosteroid isomerase-like protein